ncbi:hypothetical protein OG897_30075 [Streptomyces sp. NBC_00237]|uniref:hypothetical protein n=1 Tax=Streptomyces sp. NBC_00237 TaxID=2975687 RepID=UPI002251FE0E|nr:hypothetical protein [Streptomyces sp. NBC_00237]MCX5205689.1 hypothetical protein [Streptomyces sp. NBC_00237]
MVGKTGGRTAAVVALAALTVLTGCGGGKSETGYSGSSPSPSGTHAEASELSAPGRDAVDREVEEATAKAKLTGLSPSVDPAATAPSGKRLAPCTTLWSGFPDASAGKGTTGAKPYAAAVAELEKRGWQRESRTERGQLVLVSLKKGDWIIRSSLKESDRTDVINVIGVHDSCAPGLPELPELLTHLLPSMASQ